MIYGAVSYVGYINYKPHSVVGLLFWQKENKPLKYKQLPTCAGVVFLATVHVSGTHRSLLHCVPSHPAPTSPLCSAENCACTSGCT